MIDTQNETLIPVSEIPRHLPGRRVHVATIWRWLSKRGCRGQRLDSVLIGGKRYSSIEAVERFIAATTAAGDGQPVRQAARTKAREQELDRLEREFERTPA